MDNEYDSSDSNGSQIPIIDTPDKTITTVIEEEVEEDSGKGENIDLHLTKMNSRYKSDGSFRGKFADLDFTPQASIFDRDVVYGSEFYGLYVAFWFSVAMVALNIVVKYYTQHGSIFRSILFNIMITDIWQVGLTDLLMYLASYFPVILQRAIRAGYLKWRNTGRLIQSIYEAAFLWFFLCLSDCKDYPWIAKIFLMLHSVVFLMKMHSFGFYNGYMWDITTELHASKKYLKDHPHTETKIKQSLENSIEFCSFELQTQAQKIPFPDNLTFFNYFEYSSFPTLVYEVAYPRNDHIRWGYLFGKVCGIFGVIFVMVTIAQNSMYPLVMKCLELRATVSPWSRAKAYPMILVEMIPPFLSLYMLTFFLIWELILNAIAELSRFADREFYHAWWNSTDWNDYSRDWNVVVHKFLLRHVYHSTISAFHVNKITATFVTFLLSSLIHEVAMYVLFRKVRFYLLGLQMCQLPLIQLMRSKLFKKYPVIANVFFWFGLLLGPSLLCTTYLIF